LPDLDNEQGIHRPELTETWSSSFLTPLIAQLGGAYTSSISAPPASTGIAAALAELADTMRGKARRADQDGNEPDPTRPDARDEKPAGPSVEDRTEAGIQLILACLALLEGQARRENEPSIPASSSPSGSPPAERQMNKLRRHYEADFDAVFAATQARHSTLQQVDLGLAAVEKTASDIYAVLQRRMAGFSPPPGN